jgi:hypothetical protein
MRTSSPSLDDDSIMNDDTVISVGGEMEDRPVDTHGDLHSEHGGLRGEHPGGPRNPVVRGVSQLCPAPSAPASLTQLST